jgi:hypothetical protein
MKKKLNDLLKSNNQSLKFLKDLYKEMEISDADFKDNSRNLKKAFKEMTKIWLTNFDKIETVKYILIAEAPLWGESKSYVYNTETPLTQFFYKSDLERALDISLCCKKRFLEKLNEIGFLIIDISPFALNNKTKINYSEQTEVSKKISPKNYQKLVSSTMPFYFEKKLELIKSKLCEKKPVVFFRYSRVQKAFENILIDSLKHHGIIDENPSISSIGMNGGGINVEELKKIINRIPY